MKTNIQSRPEPRVLKLVRSNTSSPKARASRKTTLHSFALSLLASILLMLFSSPAFAERNVTELSHTAVVNLPLSDYNQLVDKSRNAKTESPAAPASYALGQATINLNARVAEDSASAHVTVDLRLSVVEDEWTAVPILPAGTAIKSVTVDGTAVELIANPRGLLWGTKTAGSYTMKLEYSVDGTRNDTGVSLSIPVPQAAATRLVADLPGVNLETAVIPSAGIETTVFDASTRLSATIPTTAGIHLSWRSPSSGSHSLSRATYQGELQDEAVIWNGELQVELFGEDAVKLKLLPRSSTISELLVDGQTAPILVEDQHFATWVSGKGSHTITLNFREPINKQNGPPQVVLNINPIPVSRFELRLPGKKELKVSPIAQVTHLEADDWTTATVFVPMTEQVVFSWNEAVPTDLQEDVRANASIYHLAYAEEGALYLHAIVNYEITRGSTSLIELLIPADVLVNRVESQSGLIADWRVAKSSDGTLDTLSIFLDRKLDTSFDFEVFYDRSIVGEKAREKVIIPLVSAKDVHRQRGMAALLSSKELTLKPEQEDKLTRVGENQLPAIIRAMTDKTIAHTYKYVESFPTLVVQAAKPERRQGKFDAMVNTLISLSDVTMKGSATVEVNVKSGGIQNLELLLPPEVNFLSLTAPSLRTHKVTTEDGQQIIDVQFTQEMEGQFRIEAAYEKIMSDSESSAVVPTVTIRGAEVEQGRIAVEALSAVEVQPAQVRQLSSIEPSELPQQLILKTSNPILLAYKYVYTDPIYQLSLKITRHKEIDVQSATIDQAHYRTLLTEDGLAVTAASFMVRNSRKQFLRVALPPNSTVWSAFVDGKSEKPALAEQSGEEGSSEVLIKIINSATAFPVQILYQTPLDKIGRIGVIDATLPRPDMVTINSRWDLYVPESVSYATPKTNMKLIDEGSYVSSDAISREVSHLTANGGSVTPAIPLHFSIPAAGLRYSFEKLYANQTAEDPYIRLAYASGIAKYAAIGLMVIGSGLTCYGIGLLALSRSRKALPQAGGFLVGGLLLLGMLIGYLGANPKPAIITSLAILLGFVGYQSRAFWKTLAQSRAHNSVGETVPPATAATGEAENEELESSSV